MADRWMSVEEMAAYLGVSKDTIYGWITKREMPAHKVGRLGNSKPMKFDLMGESGKSVGRRQ